MADVILPDYEFHPLANIFPLIDGQAYQDLMSDVLRHGVREPVWMYDGKILDGRNRYRAAKAMRIECPMQEYTGQDATAFVISLNLHRRHLNESQRGMVAAKLANLQHGQKTSDAQICASAVTQDDAADLLNVSRRTVQAAAKVQAEAPQEVAKAVEAGSVSINLATQFVALPDEDKQEAVQAIAAQPESAKEVMREAVKNAHVAHNSGDNEWYTPPKFIELARQVMGGIDLDPATSEVANRVVQAPKIFTAEDDGRAQQWSGRVWMNPPVCGCRVHPKLVKLGDGNKNLPSLPESLASHIGLVLAQSGHAVSGLLVQGLCQGEGAITAARETEFPGKETKTSGGKTAVLQERKGSGEQEAAIHCGQPQAQGEASSRAVDVEQGGMGPSEARMGLRLRILRDAVGAVDTGSLHSFISSCLSGDGAKQYGPMLPELQLQQGVSDGSRLDQGQASVCPDCGLAGYSVAVPSRVFMNPPYAQPLMSDFAEAVSAKYESGEIEQACILVNNATETKWFQRMLEASSAVCFPKSRIKFLDPDGNPGAPLQGQAIVYMGDSVEAFKDAFKAEGAVLIND